MCVRLRCYLHPVTFRHSDSEQFLHFLFSQMTMLTVLATTVVPSDTLSHRIRLALLQLSHPSPVASGREASLLQDMPSSANLLSVS